MKIYLIAILSLMMCSSYAQKIEIELINGYTNKPIADFKLNFVNKDDEVVDSQVSNENGIIKHKFKEPVRVLEDRQLSYFKTFPLEISSQFSNKTFIHYFYPTKEAEKRIMQWEKNHPGRRVPDFSMLDDVELEVEKKDANGKDEELEGDIPVEVVEVEEDTTKVDESKKVIVDYPDKEATFPKGVDNMKKFLAHNIQYPEISMVMGDQGKVFVQFVVEKNGLISQVKVLRGVSDAINAETIRVVRSMPNWSPAEAKSEIVRARCRIPINFILQ